MYLTWLEISKKALSHNIQTFRKLIGKDIALAPTIKANAYGHGMIECARVFVENGVDYLCANALYEVEDLRKAGIKIPILLIGYAPLSDLKRAIQLKTELTIYNTEAIKELGKIGKKVNVHIKIETGNHRQGIRLEDIPSFCKLLKRYSNIKIKGVSTHFANIEDRINHEYALYQLDQFKKAIKLLEKEGIKPKYRHCANTAATILMPESYFNFVRTGIGNYGLWPSWKTKSATERAGIKVTLKPAMTWKTIVSQIKEVKKGAFIGYGCTYKMPHNGRIAILPLGYYDGFARLLSNHGFVLISGKKAPVIGRICMNMIMVDITNIPNVKLEDEVVLIGRQKKAKITVEEVGEWSHTINYEVTTRINERILRILKD